MADQADGDVKNQALRDRAKKWQTSTGKKTIEGMPIDDIAELLYELETHQIELEIQNEELRRAQLELAEIRDQYSELYDLAPTGYLTLDAQGCITRANLTIAQMLEIPRSRLIQQPLTSFIVREDQDVFYRHRTTLIDHGESRHCELRLRTQSSESLWVNLDSILVMAPDNGFWLIRSVISDISSRKKAEAEQERLQSDLRQAQKMQAIGVLSGNIAHEFNNLLTPILGLSQLLLMKTSEGQADYSKLELIENAATRAGDLTRQLLAYGRQSLSQFEPVKLEESIDDAIKLINNAIAPNVLIKKAFEQNLPAVSGMPNEIQQVILNLCINASHAMPEGGELLIRLENVPWYRFDDSSGRPYEGQFLRLSVQDTGTGMTPETMQNIFDPFFTTKTAGKGSGLGLSVAQGIIAQHKGHIEVKSTPREGSVFHVYLPVTREAISPLGTNSKFGPLKKGSERVLLIDDEPAVLEATQSVLVMLGYRVTTCLDGESALKQLSLPPREFDLVVTDYGMPQMNGKQLAARIKQICPTIPIILMTGYGDLIAHENITAWGIDGLLLKPFNLQEINKTVADVLARAAG